LIDNLELYPKIIIDYSYYYARVRP